MTTIILSILAGIGGMIGWGIYDFLGSVYTKKIGAIKSFFWSQLAGMVSAFILAYFLAIPLNISLKVMLLFLIAAIVYSAGYLFFFKGFELGHVSIVAASMNLWAVFTMLFAFIFMGQRLTSFQTLGVVMILLGVALVSLDWNEIRKQGFKLSQGVKEAILGAFFFGIFWNISELISEEVGWLLATLLIKTGIIVFLLIFSFTSKQKVGLTTPEPKVISMIILMGVIETGAVATVNYGLTIGDAILITPIASALSIVTIALAILFLKESVTRLQGFGILTTISGIIVTAF